MIPITSAIVRQCLPIAAPHVSALEFAVMAFAIVRALGEGQLSVLPTAVEDFEAGAVRIFPGNIAACRAVVVVGISGRPAIFEAMSL